MKTCDGSNLARDITAKTEQEAKEDRNIKGRQILWMIYEYFKSNEQTNQLFQVVDLMKVQLHNGDRGLEKFISTWDGVF